MSEHVKHIAARFLDVTICPVVRYIVSSAMVPATQAAIRKEIDELRAHILATTPGNPCAQGFKTYAQIDEDGILEDIFDRIPGHSTTFIEIGCGHGIENNTHYMALKGYKGCWVDGGEKSVASIREALGGLSFDSLLVEHQFVSTDNVGSILRNFVKFLGTHKPGLFSLDIDGNDLYVLTEALKHIKPVVICVEYNAKFPPPLSLSICFDPDFRWQGDDYHGASLQAFCDLLTDYRLVSCNLSGSNAFFVRRDVANAFADYTPSELYQPFRANLMNLRSQHRPSMKWLRTKLAENLRA